MYLERDIHLTQLYGSHRCYLRARGGLQGEEGVHEREREQNTQVRKNRVRVAAESPALMLSDLSSEHAPRMSPSGFFASKIAFCFSPVISLPDPVMTSS